MIKRWIQFISENVVLNDVSYPIDETTLSDFFIMFEDNEYLIEIYYGCWGIEGYTDNKRVYNHPTIRVVIKKTENTTRTDISNYLPNIVSKIKSKCERIIGKSILVEVHIGDNSYHKKKFDADKITISDGFKSKLDIYYSIKEYMEINIILPIDERYKSPTKIIEYYGIKNSKNNNLIFENDKAYYIITNTKLAEDMVDDKCYYKKYLQEDIDLNSPISDYTIDSDSFIEYHLDSDNLRLFLKLVHKNGEFGYFKSQYEELNDIDLSDKSDEEVIDYMVKKNTYISDIIKDIEPSVSIWDEIKNLYDQYERDALEYAYYKAVQDEFERKVDKNFSNSSTFKREDGELCWKIEFTKSWLTYIDEDDVRDADIDDLFSAYISDDKISLDPYLPDSGDVDDAEYNRDAKNILENALKNN